MGILNVVLEFGVGFEYKAGEKAVRQEEKVRSEKEGEIWKDQRVVQFGLIKH